MNIRKVTFAALAIALILSILIPASVFAQTPPTIITNDATGIATSSATLNGNLTSLGTATPVIVSFEYGETTSYGKTTPLETMGGTGTFSTSLTGLAPGTLYHFRAKAVGDGTANGTDMTFTTAVIVPTVTTTDNATNITSNSATLGGNLTDLGTATTADVSFEYGTTTSYGTTTPAQVRTATGTFSASLAGLTPNTTYHLRAKADAGVHGTANGTDTTFTTLTTPTVVTLAATNITIDSASLNGNLTDLGTAPNVIVSFEYGETTDYGETTLVESFSGTGTFSYDLPSLTPGTLYHFRAKAVGDGTANGADMTFTTVASLAVITDPATNVGFNSATLNGNLISLGAATTVSVSFEYGTTTSYGTTTTPQEITSTGTFSYNLDSLTQETTYYFRAKVDGGEHGTAVGNDMAFDTLKPLTVSTSAATSVTTKEATLNGNLMSLGAAATVDVFFEYGENTSYGRTTPVEAKTGKGTFSASLIGLDPGTTYHFRAQANAGAYGTAIGADVTFATVPPMTPAVDTLGSANVTATSAIINGNLTSMGSADTVSVSFEYGTTTSYGTTTTAQAMSGTGEFNTEITGLSPGTTYHFRVKADGGEHGIAEGDDRSFTTQTPTSPVVRSSPATGITSVNATLNGELIYLGSASTANVSFEYGTTTSYGSNTTAQAMTDTGIFGANLTGLDPGTDYHFRAVATANGTANGADKTFRTLAPIPPVVITSAASNVTSNTTTLSGNLTSLGTATTVDVFFEYGTTTSYGTTTPAQEMTGTGAFSANLTGLSPGTDYHFRAKADGGAHGTATGASTNFTTQTPIPPVVDTVVSANVTPSSVTVSGNLTSLGTAPTVDVFFEYGTNTSYGGTTSAQTMNGTGTFSANLTGLSSNTTYHFRARADGGIHGIATGNDMIFTTGATLLVVSTSAASNITNTSAALSGNLTDLGPATTANVSFEYGTASSYGNATPVQTMNGTGTFTADITGLSPGATYHFQAMADGGIHGVANGTNKSFTTTGTPAPSGGGGGGGERAPGVTFVADVITDKGEFTFSVSAKSEDSRAKLTIDKGIVGKTKYGLPLSSLSIVPMERSPSPPAQAVIIGLAYDLGPDGATFDPPATLTFTYDPDEIPKGVNQKNLVIAMWDEGAGEWVTIEDGTIDPIAYTITAPVSHFTAFTVVAHTRPPAFTTSFLTISPTEVTTGEVVTIGTMVTNNGDVKGGYEVTLKVDNVVVATRYVILDGRASQTITFTTSMDVPGSYTGSVNGRSVEFTVKTSTAPPPRLAPAAFTAGSLTISPAEVATGKTITINVLVTNIGGLKGTYKVVLKINSVLVGTEDVTLAGGTTQKVTFTTSKDTAGTYIVNVGALSGTFTVKTPTAPANPIIGIIIVGSIAIALVGCFVAWWKRRPLILLLDKIFARFMDKRIVRTYSVRRLGFGKHALIIEFGVRTGQTEGLHVGVNMDTESIDVRGWFDKPNTPTITVIKKGIVKKFIAQYEPQKYERKERYMSLTPLVSYYWYFEAEEPLQVKEVLFLDYHDRKP